MPRSGLEWTGRAADASRGWPSAGGAPARAGTPRPVGDRRTAGGIGPTGRRPARCTLEAGHGVDVVWVMALGAQVGRFVAVVGPGRLIVVRHGRKRGSAV